MKWVLILGGAAALWLASKGTALANAAQQLRIAWDGIAWDNANPSSLNFTIKLLLSNPTAQPLQADNVQGTVYLGSSPVARVMLTQLPTIAPNATTEVRVPVRVGTWELTTAAIKEGIGIGQGQKPDLLADLQVTIAGHIVQSFRKEIPWGASDLSTSALGQTIKTVKRQMA